MNTIREVVEAMMKMVPNNTLDAPLGRPSEPANGPELLLKELPHSVPVE